MKHIQYSKLTFSSILDFPISTSCALCSVASPMNMHRWGHGIGVLTIRNKDELIIFGGMSAFTGLPMDSIEAYDAKTQTWKRIDKKLSKPKQTFGYLTIKEDDLHRLPFSTTKMIGKASETLVDLFTYFSGF